MAPITRILAWILGFLLTVVFVGVVIEIFSGHIWAFIQGHAVALGSGIGLLVLVYLVALVHERGFFGPASSATAEYFRGHIPHGFVQPLASGGREQEFTEKIESPLYPFVIDWLASDDPRRARYLAILGEYGTGKTSFCFYLAYRLAVSWRWSRRFQVKLIQFGHDKFDAEIDKLTPEQRRKTFLILDAFDEDEAAMQDYVARWRQIAAQLGDFPKVLLTSRIEFFADPATEVFETDTSTGPTRIGQKDFQKIFISFYNPRQIRRVLRKKSGRWPLSWWRAWRKYRKISSRPNLFDVARRPVFLAYLRDDGLQKLAKQDVFSDAEIYATITEGFLQQKYSKTGSKSEWRLPPESGIAILSALGYYLQTNIKTKKEVAVAQLPELVEELSHRIGRDDIKEFERFTKQIYGQSFLEKRRDGVYGFSHRSFTEYFAARFVVEYSPTFSEPLPAVMRDRQVMAFANQIIRAEERRSLSPDPPPGMVYIPSGFFIMGSEQGNEDEKPAHLQRVAGFYMAQWAVTQKEWQQVMGNNPSYFKGLGRPVEQVTWHDCQKYLKRLSAAEGWTFRLPTEAEWEYACRAGSQTEYFFGDDAILLSRFAWYDENSNGKTHLVGQKQPNAWELYNMLGNVWEWCSSIYQPYPYNPDDGREQLDAGNDVPRVLRGGAFDVDANNLRAALRLRRHPDLRYRDLGFRVVLAPVTLDSEHSGL